MDEKDSDKATIIKNALNVSLADKKDVLMIGDRCFDIKGALKKKKQKPTELIRLLYYTDTEAVKKLLIQHRNISQKQ